jgi:hypothetical protein
MRRLKKTRQLLMYTLAIGVLIFGTVALVFFAQGYSYDFHSGQVHKNGLVLLDSHPNGASITINGKALSNKTPYRYDNAPAGQVDIQLQKSGYRDWNTSQSVVASQVTFIEYPLLLPNSLTRQSILSPVAFSNISMSVSADNKKAVAISTTDTDVYLIAENGSTRKIYSSGGAKIASATLSPDGARALVTQIAADNKREQIIVATDGGQPINLTSTYGFIFANLQFSPENSADLYWLENGSLHKVDTTARTISSALAANVAAFSLSQDRIIITMPSTRAPSTTDTIVSTNLDGGDKHDIVAMPLDPAGYSGTVIHSRFHSYLALRSNSAPFSLYNILEPNGNSVIPNKLSEKVRLVTYSPNQKYLTYLNDAGLQTVDLETSRQYGHALDTSAITSIQWYDDYHAILHSPLNNSLIDFDGFNNQIVATNSVSAFLLPGDSKSLLYVNLNGGLEKVYLEPR